MVPEILPEILLIRWAMGWAYIFKLNGTHGRSMEIFL